MRCITVKFVLPIALVAVGLWLSPGTVRAATADFEDLTLTADSQWNGVDATYDNGSGDSNPFQSHGVTFSNFHEFAEVWGYPTHYWDGWAYSNRSDTASTGMAGQYTAMGSGASGQNGVGGSANYGVGYPGYYSRLPAVSFGAESFIVDGAYFTNIAYVYHSMKNGDSFAKKFGANDWFLLTISGKDAGGAVVGTETFYLADFPADFDPLTDNPADYIVDDWTWVDLSGLGEVNSLEFGLTSSDVGSYGMNTPAYFAMDSLTVQDTAGVPEPSSAALAILGLSFVLSGRKRRRRGA